jgi:hypothetical protein
LATGATNWDRTLANGGGMNSDVAVIVCTHLEERLELLCDALRSLETQTQLPDEVVVVVDGNAQLADRVRALDFDVHVLCMSKNGGLATARNAGVAACVADKVMFLDDDAIAEPHWIEGLASAMDQVGILGASGSSEPIWKAPRPAWLADEFMWTLGCSYAGQPTTSAHVRNVYGGCCGLRRKLFTELDGYDLRLGRSATSAGGGEEAELCLRAHARWPDSHFAFVPSAGIRHTVPADRLSLRYLLKRSFDEGRMKAAVAGMQPGALSPERSFAAHLPRALVAEIGHGLMGDVRGFAKAGGIALMAAAVIAGLTVGQLKLLSAAPDLAEPVDVPQRAEAL